MGGMNRELEENLEALIDAQGIDQALIHVLTLMECICSEKAEHIRVNWQDSKLAKGWDKSARRCYKLAFGVEKQTSSQQMRKGQSV